MCTLHMRMRMLTHMYMYNACGLPDPCAQDYVLVALVRKMGGSD